MPDLGFVPAQRPAPGAASADPAPVLATAGVRTAAAPSAFVATGAVTTPGLPAAQAPAPATASAAPALAAPAPVTGEAVAFRPSPLATVVTPDKGAYDAGRAEGFAAGYAAGAREAARVAQEEAARARAAQEARRAAAQDALDRALAVLATAAAAAAARTVPVVHDVEARLHEAALDLATAVLGVELADHGLGARAALARVLAHVDGTEPVTVRLHPADLAALPAAADATGVAPTVPDGVTLVADPTLAPGDAVADLPDGFLDARLDGAVARARAALRGDA
ncbi:FliH/SctL family protein [Cellulomonas fimi]|uniref:Flagellar assembly protein FliH/Type III secretion system HrpE domain-containing protein n=1 Tax=Cellulomonas fimi (strain ATCC 484 / DSM 20113 / JCM 1341 / CCUG 24087 / LMG 16345 / NBRC 15513 / NCIMB 8980 / NCTC 7547 / NRS-133) TaxID=590998 RepID=F4GYU4_CELFA|nr:FliH/SctL family protein [Cellulomonas fimi]AEE44813.1 hypothetical protein Celf_0673 [Cellulomonas fimi ATCC 484]NNH08371.1 flagellar assembly protein FliH [Cellulomonas fimi]VEH27365.1 flagellar assembly protein H [Cellulomonas fimi]